MLYDHDLTGGRSLPLKKYGLRIHSSGSVQQLVGIMVRHIVVEFREIDSLGLHYLVGRYMVVFHGENRHRPVYFAYNHSRMIAVGWDGMGENGRLAGWPTQCVQIIHSTDVHSFNVKY